MTTTLKKLAPTQVELEINISDEELEAARERAFRKLAKNAKIPGFRPGKAPRKLFEAQYGSGIIAERAMEDVVPDVYSKAIREHALEPVDRPQMELLPHEDGQPLRLRATVAVRPEIELHDYKGLALSAVSSTATEEDVERSLAALRREAATLTPVDRPVQLGDHPTIDFEGKIEGVPFDGGSAQGQPTEILEDRFIPGFASGIVGMRAGETKDVEARFPDDYSNADLAGKTATFTVTVHEIKEAVLPELGDEFASEVSNSTTLADLRTDLRRRLDLVAASKSRRALTAQLIDKLLATHEFPLPEVLVERELENLLGDTKAQAARYGRDWAADLEAAGKTEQSLRLEMRTDAEQRVKSTLLLEAIAKAEGIEATTADVEAEIAGLSQQYNQPKEKILAMLRSNLSMLIDGIVRSKTVEFLLNAAKIEGGPPPTAQTATPEPSPESTPVDPGERAELDS